MRKITFGGANSLDNYLARKDHAVDWVRWNDEAAAVMPAYWKTIDTILMGRKTYEAALSGSRGKKPYPGMKTYVLSKTRVASGHPDHRGRRALPCEMVRVLLRRASGTRKMVMA